MMHNKEKDILLLDPEKIEEEKDNKLSSEFSEANKDSVAFENVPLRNLFSEEEKQPEELVDITPSEELIRELEETLDTKDIHHKKLLEEGSPTNIFSKLFFKLKTLFALPEWSVKHKVSLTPESWKMYSIIGNTFKKNIKTYFGYFSSLLELHLKDQKKSLDIFKREIIATLLVFIFSIPIISLFSRHISFNSDLDFFSTTWTRAIIGLSVVSLVFVSVPPFLFMSLWFVNINYLHKSKYFHLFLFTFLSLAVFFMALSLFNVVIFYLSDYWFGLISAT